MVATIQHTDPVIVLLTIDGETLETTADHPFYTEDGEWVDAADLQLGDDIRTLDGNTGEVEAVLFLERTQPMYNLTVAEAHTFFVGDGQWLVHNTNYCDAIKSGKNGDDFEQFHKDRWRKKIINEGEKFYDEFGVELGEIDFETAEAIVEVGINLRNKLRQLHKLAEVAVSKGKRLDVIYGPRTDPRTVELFKESLRKKFGNRVRFIPG